jgi:hypothetical protein
MPIGYANFGNIQQGNQQVVNSMAGLGQSISNAIETHAATQSAQAMLPVIQNQYSTGMQKIASGDQGGMADIMQAAGLAGQNPYTAHLSNQFITGMTQVNEMARTKAINEARLDAINARGEFNASLSGQKFNQSLGLQQQEQVNQLERLNQRDKLQLNQIEQKHQDRLKEIDQLTGNQKDNALVEENNKFANQKAFWDYKLANPTNSAVDPIKQVQAAKAGVAIQNTYQAEMDKALEEGNEEKYNRAAHELSAFSQNATQAGIPSSGIQLSYSARKKATDLATRLNRVSGGILGNPQKAEDYTNQLQQLRNDPSNYVLTDDQKSTLSDAQEAYEKTKNLPAIQEVLQKNGIPSNLLKIPSQQQVPSKLPAATPPAGNIPGVNVPMNALPTTMLPAAQPQDQAV